MGLETVGLLCVAALAVGLGVGWVVATARVRAAGTDSAARVAALEATLQAETQARDTARRERDEVRALLASREADASKVREDVSRLSAEKAAVATQAESLAQRLAEEEARGRATLERKGEVEAKLSATSSELATYRDGAERQRAELETRLAAADTAVAALRAECERLQGALAESETRLARTSAELSAAQVSLQAALTSAAAVEAELRARLEAADQTIRTSTEKISQFQADLEHERTLAAATRTELESERSGHVRTREDTAERLQQLRADVDREAREARSLRAVLEEARVENSKLLAELTKEREAHQEKVKAYQDAEVRLTAAFEGLASNALHTNNERFIELARRTTEELQKKAGEDFEQRQTAIASLVEPIEKTLGALDEKVQKSEAERIAAAASLLTRLEAVDASTRQVSKEAGNLVNALKKSGVRGRWGELQLRRVVELAGLVDHCDFDEQQSLQGQDGRLRPDLIVRMPGRRSLVVDSKAPLEAYLHAQEEASEEKRAEYLAQHAKAVRDHLKSLADRRYAEHLETSPDFVVMFLPGEAFFSAAIDQDPELLAASGQNKVILASPTTLLALLLVVAYGWRQDSLAQNARDIAALGQQFHDRICQLADHLSHVGKHLGQSVEAYNSAIGSLESRLLPTARRLKALHAAGAKDVTELNHVDLHPRALRAPELLTGGPGEIIDAIPDSEAAVVGADRRVVASTSSPNHHEP